MDENKRKRTGAADRAVIAAFAVFLAVLFFAGLLRQRETFSFFENRNLAEKPALTAESAVSGEYFRKLDSYLADHAPGRNTLLKADAFIDLKLLRLPVVNDIVVQDDILLPYLDYDMFSMDGLPQAVSVMTENLSSVKDACDSVGAAYYLVAVPGQYTYFEDRYPRYLNNNSEYIAESRLLLEESLDMAGVRHMDIGDVFAGLGSPEEFGSTVDHHYTLKGAFAAYRAIMERVMADTGLQMPVPEESEVTFTELPNLFIGSRSRKLMNLWSDGERLSYMTSELDVPFSRRDRGQETESFLYAMPADPGEWLTYEFYMGGDISETVIDTDRDWLPNVLIYGDSFTNAVECVAYQSFNEMRSLDLRYYKDKTLGEYIREYAPDIVICIRDYSVLVDPTGNGKPAN